jgi:hypothetical protein
MQKKRLFFGLIVILLVLAAGCTPGTFVQTRPAFAGTQTATPAPNGQINVPAMSIKINAPGPNSLAATADANGQIAGVALGLWHGIIAPVTVSISFFYPGVQMYEVHNDGSQYNLGFLLGVAIVFVVLGAFFGSRRR